MNNLQKISVAAMVVALPLLAAQSGSLTKNE